MAKRFTDTEKWKKGFFKHLPIVYKLFWNYLCDECSNTGIWETSEVDIASMRIGNQIDLKKALELFNEGESRVIEFDNKEKWFLATFPTFQYGDDFLVKESKNRLIERVRCLLEKDGLLSLIPVKYPLNTLYERVKDMDLDKDKDKRGKGVKGEGSYPQAFEDFWKSYPSRNGKKLLKRDAAFQFAKLDEAMYPSLMQAVRHYAESGQLPKDAPRFLKDEYWREWVEKPEPNVSSGISKKPPNTGPDKETLEKWKREQAPPPAEVGELIEKLGGKMGVK